MLQAIHALFNHPTARRVFLWLRYPITIALIAAVAFTARLDLFWPAVAVSAVGEAIQLWSFASLVKNEQLTARGPYVLVRNPMYLGRYFLILGFLLLPGKLWIPVVYTVLYYFYMVNRVGREEKRLAELLGEPYRNYCARTARFLPALSRLGDPMLRYFDIGVLTRNNGHWNLLSAVVAYAALAAYLFVIR
jgi:protein-S-isoprenylcysteine O-methyltransferase Ste14